ncbi:MAG: hypothetical protein GY918_10515, partial [Gammaproteobacteria bacterium]|nr:hypothetical protein [Gammaproteobacteria bacterium]
MAIYRGTGGSGDATNNATITEVTQQATSAQNSATNAATSATNAATSATTAAEAAANLGTSETNAATSATNAATSATNAATSATNAATSETNAQTAVSSALPKAGGTMTGDLELGDDVKVTFGDSDDLQIYFDGYTSFIKDATTDGPLELWSNQMYFRNGAGTKQHIRTADGSGVTLFYDGDTALTTKDYGISVSGTLKATGDIKLYDSSYGKLKIGNDDDLQIYHDGANSYIKNVTNSLIIQNDSNDKQVIIKSDNGSGGVADYFRANGTTGEALLYHYGSSKLATTSSGVDISGTMSADNATLTGYLRGPSSFVIDPAAHGDDTGMVVVAGNLQVDGTTTTINSTTVNVDDKNVQLATGSTNKAAADGSGITVDLGTDGTTSINYDGTDDQWEFGKNVDVTGTVSADALTVDNITIDGNEIDVSSGNLTLDASGDIILDADGADIIFADGGTQFGFIGNSSSDMVMKSQVQDKDIIFKGNDGGSTITALTLDMSDAGAATFNAGADFSGTVTADGLTVDGAGSIGLVATDRLYMATSDGLGIQLDKDNNRIVPVGADGSAYNNNVSLGASGLEFKNLVLSGTATMDGLTVDGDVGIGEDKDNFYTKLVVGDLSGADEGIQIASSTSGKGSLLFADGGGNVGGSSVPNFTQYRGWLRYDHNTDKMDIATSGTTAMVIDSSGNVDISGTATMDGLTVDGAADIDYQSGATNNTAPDTLKVSNKTTGLHAAGLGASIKFEHTNSSASYSGSRISNVSNVDPFTSNLSFYPYNYGYKEAMRISSNGDISFYEDTGTTPKFHWDAADERLGIGTSSPASPLTINGTDPLITFENGESPHWQVGFENTQSDRFVFYDNNASAYRMVIDSSGNVGIGVTPESHYTGYVALDIGDSGGLYSNNTGTNATLVTDNSYLNSGVTDWLYKNTDEASQYVQSSGTHKFKVAASGTADSAISWTNAMTMDNSGNVLVGRTSSSGVDTDGHVIFGNGVSYQSNTDNGVQFVNRNGTADGALTTYYKNGTPVGSISARSGDLLIGTGDTGLRFDDGADAYIPFNVSTSTGRDAGINLGHSSARFKKLFLSGYTRYNSEVYVGDGASISGTYSANDLLLHTDNNPIVIRPNGSEAARFDASGNLLVGCTDTTPARNNDAGGMAFTAGGRLEVSQSGGPSADFNRSNDGDVVRILSAGIAVGSIAARGGAVTTLILDPRTNGVGITGTANAILPTTNTGGITSTAVDLGAAGYAYRDLHLSGAAKTDTIANESTGTTTTSTTQTAIATFAKADYDSAKVVISAKSGTDVYSTELLIVHNGTTASATEYGQIGTGSALATFDVDISGSNVRVLATAASSTS